MQECAPDSVQVECAGNRLNLSLAGAESDADDYTKQLCIHVEEVLRNSTQQSTAEEATMNSSQIDYVVCQEEDWHHNEEVTRKYNSWYLNREHRHPGQLVLVFCPPENLVGLCTALTEQYTYKPILRQQTPHAFSKLLANRFTICYDVDSMFVPEFPRVRWAILVPACSPTQSLTLHDIEEYCWKGLCDVVLGVEEIINFARRGIRYDAQHIRSLIKPILREAYPKNRFESIFEPDIARQDSNTHSNTHNSAAVGNRHYFSLTIQDLISRGMAFRSIL